MSIATIHLRKLLFLFYATASLRTSALRADIRTTIKREGGGAPGDGGDFHGPFWADAKTHALGHGDLDVLTADRVAANRGRGRLYPLLSAGFLTWWNERRRWRNEPLAVLAGPPKAQLPIAGGLVKVENIMALESGPTFQRLIYPYFAEEPALEADGGRLGLWAMQESLPRYRLEDMRVLDVLRSRTFGVADYPLIGDERTIFADRYRRLQIEWDVLRRDYP